MALVPLRVAGRTLLVNGASLLHVARFALATTFDGRNGLYLSIGGRDYTRYLEPGWKIVRRTGVRSEMAGRVIVPPGVQLPRNGEEVEARTNVATGALVFGGYVDEPDTEIEVGLDRAYDWGLQAIGWRARLDDWLLTQAQGIDIAGRTTGADQIRALVAVLAGEGFTSTVMLASHDTHDPDNFRLENAGPMLDRTAALNLSTPTVSPTKVVDVTARSLLTATVHLDRSNTMGLRVEDSRQNYRTAQTVRFGDLTLLQSFAGAANGRYRLGGAQNLEPARSFFDPMLALGNGVLWRDGPRTRGGTGRGDSQTAVLIEAADGADQLPPSVVSGADRAITLFNLEARPTPFSAATGNERLLYRRTATVSAGSLFIGSAEPVGGGAGFNATGLAAVTGTDTYRLGVPTNADGAAAQAFVTANEVHVAVRVGGSIYHGRLNPVMPNDQFNSTIATVTGLDAAIAAAANGTEVPIALWLGPVSTTAGAALRLEGPDLTDTAESNLGIAIQASGGAEYAFRLSDLTGTGGDDSEPYSWPLAVLPFGTVDDVLDAVAALRDGMSRIVIVDTTADRIDFDNRILRASATIVETEAVTVRTVDVDGTEVELGTEGADWFFSVALQEVYQDPPASPAPSSVNVAYKGRGICTETTGAVPRVERVVEQRDAATPDEARALGREELRLHGEIAETLIADMLPGLDELIAEGIGVTVDQVLLDLLPQLRGITPTDVLRVERNELSTPDGLLIAQSLRLLRYEDESRYRDDVRRMLDRAPGER